MKETLTCSSCKKNWKREKSRGRKPVFCPSCTKKIVNSKPEKVVKKEVQLKTEQPKSEIVSISKDEFKIKNIISQVYRDYYPENKDLIEETKNGSHWHCPRCRQDLVIHVPVCAVPTHHCPPNSSLIKPYERVIDGK